MLYYQQQTQILLLRSWSSRYWMWHRWLLREKMGIHLSIISIVRWVPRLPIAKIAVIGVCLVCLIHGMSCFMQCCLNMKLLTDGTCNSHDEYMIQWEFFFSLKKKIVLHGFMELYVQEYTNSFLKVLLRTTPSYSTAENLHWGTEVSDLICL